jgi:hypothetical protein
LRQYPSHVKTKEKLINHIVLLMIVCVSPACCDTLNGLLGSSRFLNILLYSYSWVHMLLFANLAFSRVFHNILLRSGATTLQCAVAQYINPAPILDRMSTILLIQKELFCAFLES